MLKILENENKNYKEVALCAIKELPYFCVGCCAYGYKPKLERTKEDVRTNTLDYEKSKTLEDFRDRTGKTLQPSGICPCLIQKNKVTCCGIHQKVIGSKEDLRKNFCNISYECPTAKFFSRMDSEEKKSFVSFILSKKLDQYTYSLQIFNGSLFRDYSENGKSD